MTLIVDTVFFGGADDGNETRAVLTPNTNITVNSTMADGTVLASVRLKYRANGHLELLLATGGVGLPPNA